MRGLRASLLLYYLPTFLLKPLEKEIFFVQVTNGYGDYAKKTAAFYCCRPLMFADSNFFFFVIVITTTATNFL